MRHSQLSPVVLNKAQLSRRVQLIDDPIGSGQRKAKTSWRPREPPLKDSAGRQLQLTMPDPVETEEVIGARFAEGWESMMAGFVWDCNGKYGGRVVVSPIRGLRKLRDSPRKDCRAFEGSG